MIRKRARTTLAYCRRCGGERDFVGIRAAAELFGVSVGDLSAFVFDNAVHYEASDLRDKGICVASLLAMMETRQNRGCPRLTGTSQAGFLSEPLA